MFMDEIYPKVSNYDDFSFNSELKDRRSYQVDDYSGFPESANRGGTATNIGKIIDAYDSVYGNGGR